MIWRRMHEKGANRPQDHNKRGDEPSTPGQSTARNDQQRQTDDVDEDITIAQLKQQSKELQETGKRNAGHDGQTEIERFYSVACFPENVYTSKSGEGKLIFHYDPNCHTLSQTVPYAKPSYGAPGTIPMRTFCYRVCQYCAMKADNYKGTIALYELGPMPKFTRPVY